ncbi:NTF2 fold immunity protein [Burkholderia anthina]|uniref:NTF2 fold immunity protein n=1 Tax=Burkholderia anthina TaxID=179879 RepID=UPI00158BDEF1|nr:NTF2 fold immunity protein [Burkholderia anthina]
MNSDVREDGQKELIAFLDSMNNWEGKYHNLMVSAFSGMGDVDSVKKGAKSDLEGIFSKYSIKKKTDWGRLDLVNAGWPATYDKNRDEMTLCHDDEKNSIFEYKQNIVGGWVIRFHMKNLDGKWMICKAEHFDDLKNSWKRHVL